MYFEYIYGVIYYSVMCRHLFVDLKIYRYYENINEKIIFIPLWILLSMVCVNAKVVVYPAPVSETLSVDYVIEVDGKLIPVYTALTQHHDKKYSIAYFDFLEVLL